MLKELLVDIYKEVKLSDKLTYKDLSEMSGLAEVQIASILKHSAKGISVERMEIGLNNLGFEVVALDFKNLIKG